MQDALLCMVLLAGAGAKMCGDRCRMLCAQWRLWIRPVVFVIYGGIILGLVPYLIYTLVRRGCIYPRYLETQGRCDIEVSTVYLSQVPFVCSPILLDAQFSPCYIEYFSLHSSLCFSA